MNFKLCRVAGRSLIALLLVAVAAAGCDKKQGADQKSSAAPAAHPGTITGHIVFSGKAPELARLNTSAVPTCNHPGGLPDESVVLTDKGDLANVFVYLKEAPKSNGSSPQPPVLDQVECQYVPHV